MKALRVSRYRTKHRALGLCIYCNDPAVGRKFCAFHLEKTRLRRQALRAAVALALLLPACSWDVRSAPQVRLTDDPLNWGESCDPSEVIACGELALYSDGYCARSPGDDTSFECVVPCDARCPEWGGTCIDGKCYDW